MLLPASAISYERNLTLVRGPKSLQTSNRYQVSISHFCFSLSVLRHPCVIVRSHMGPVNHNVLPRVTFFTASVHQNIIPKEHVQSKQYNTDTLWKINKTWPSKFLLLEKRIMALEIVVVYLLAERGQPEFSLLLQLCSNFQRITAAL